MSASSRYVTAGPGVPPVFPGVPYSPAVVVGDLCFLSGQLAFDESGQLVAGEAQDEAALALRNLRATVQAAGFTLEDVASVTVLLADIADWPAVNEAYSEIFTPESAPARTAYAVDALPLGAKVEFQAIAARATTMDTSRQA